MCCKYENVWESRRVRSPLFSICIPQYNRFEHLLVVLKSILSQNMNDFEICISDDKSPESGREQILEFLEQSGCDYVYALNSQNVRYDANLRSSISLSRGKWIFLLGNDDTLRDENVLRDISCALGKNKPAKALLTNFYEVGSEQSVFRSSESKLLQPGLETIVSGFRSMSFVSGIVFDGDICRRSETGSIDGYEMYQMYLFCRLCLSKGSLYFFDRTSVDKDIELSGLEVESYKNKPLPRTFSSGNKKMPMHHISKVIQQGVKDELTDEGVYAPENAHRLSIVAGARALTELYKFTYPYWVFEYRRLQGWLFALGLAYSLAPGKLLESSSLGFRYRASLYSVYTLRVLAALFIPRILFNLARPVLYRLSGRRVTR